MDIFELIKKDHEKLRHIMDKLEKQAHTGKSSKTAESNFDKLCKEAESHMRAEEDVFYPALQQYDEAREKVMEALEEHHVAKLVLNEMKKLDIGDEHFAAKLMVFKENVLHHMQEEEENIFELCEDLLEDEQIEEITKQFTQDKKQVLARY